MSPIEIGDHAAIPFATVLVERTDEILPQIFERGIVRHLARPQTMGKGKLGSHLEPVRKVVSLGVVAEALLGNA